MSSKIFYHFTSSDEIKKIHEHLNSARPSEIPERTWEIHSDPVKNDAAFIDEIKVRSSDEENHKLLHELLFQYKTYNNTDGWKWKEHTENLCLKSYNESHLKNEKKNIWTALRWSENTIRKSTLQADFLNPKFMDFSQRVYSLKKDIESGAITTVSDHSPYFEELKFEINRQLSEMDENEKTVYVKKIRKSMKLKYAIDLLNDIDEKYQLKKDEGLYNKTIGDPEGILKLREDIISFQTWLNTTFPDSDLSKGISGLNDNLNKKQLTKLSNQARAYIIHFMVQQGIIESKGNVENSYKKIVKSKYKESEQKIFHLKDGDGSSYDEYRKIFNNKVLQDVIIRCMNEIIASKIETKGIIEQANSLKNKTQS